MYSLYDVINTSFICEHSINTHVTCLLDALVQYEPLSNVFDVAVVSVIHN